ncbi:hypothetical protein CU097_008476 [Rhizopus azygosporus]|uniref:Phosphatidylinositol-specific phospholipase C X domain-containing protein n=2 Tax=Rhizopus TaxID=4842 RepID=A0A367KBR2_RHIAZ|nr:hypothetical protein CU097_008476 [Rhizopus azygosporus]
MSSVSIFLFICLFIIGLRAECNGGHHLCNQAYNNVTFLVTHDSYALSPSIAATQDNSITQQLNDGVRGIKLTAVSVADETPSSVHVCHTLCEVLDGGPATDVLNEIAFWLKHNPKEVITIMWNNLHNIQPTEIEQAYKASEIMPFVYTHDSSDKWPTLQEMIQSGKRVVNFIDSSAREDDIPWLMDQFSRVFETPFENTELQGFNCDVDRIASNKSSTDLMYVMNHFMYGVIEIAGFAIKTPVKSNALLVNSESLVSHVDNCTAVLHKKPNFIEVDFYQLGEALSIVAKLNGVNQTKVDKNKTTLGIPGITMNVHQNELNPTKHVLIDNTNSSAVVIKITQYKVFISVITSLFMIASV